MSFIEARQPESTFTNLKHRCYPGRGVTRKNMSLVLWVSMGVSNELVSWLITHLGDLQPAYIGVINNGYKL